jgi:ABC-2 type transport system ATP-binding protein
MIEIQHLQKIVGQDVALDIPELRVEPGEIAAVVGPTDSGVDTLFELLLGRYLPSAGTIRLAGVDRADRSSLSRKVGIVFLEDALYKRQSSLANLALHSRLFGLGRSRAVEVLAQIGMADQAGAGVERLPSGLQRRLAFGRAILHKPEVLLLFDPFARCDEATIALLSSLMRQLAAQGTAILILANEPGRLTQVCDAVYALNRGRLEAQESGTAASQAQPFKIPVRSEDKVILMNPADIIFAEAEGGHASLQTAEGRLPTQFTLAELEQRLSRSGFFRAHRAYLVNLQHVKEVIPYTRNSFSLRLDDAAGTEIPLSKSAAAELRALLGY